MLHLKCKSCNENVITESICKDATVNGNWNKTRETWNVQLKMGNGWP